MLRAFSHDFIKQHRHAGSQQKGLFIWRNKMEDKIDYILKNFSYDRRSGILKRVNGRKCGYTHKSGYLRVSVLGKDINQHRVIWVLEFGKFPLGEIDHVNGIKTDNRISNLRDVSVKENRQNLRKARAVSSSGLLGAFFCKKTNKYKSQIRNNGKVIYLGRFDTKELAHNAYVEAKRVLHKGCTI